MKRPFFPAVPAALLVSALSGAVVAQQQPAPETDTPPAAPAGEEAAMSAGFNPTMPAFDRYEKMAEKSPFEFELAKGPEPVKVDLFADLALAGFVGSGSRMVVYLQNTKTQERIPVYGKGVQGRKSESGFEIVRLEKGPTRRSTKVVLSKDGEEGTVGFNTDTLYTMRGGAAGGGNAPGAPGGNNMQRGRQGQPGQPNQPVLNNNPAAAAAPQAQAFQGTARPFVPTRGGNNNNNAPQAAQAAQVTAGGESRTVSQQLSTLGNAPQATQQNPPAVIIPRNNAAGQGGGNLPPPQAKRRVVLPTQ